MIPSLRILFAGASRCERSGAVLYHASQFHFDGVAPPDPDADLGFAGFRLLCTLNRSDHFDEVCSLLGASCFRAVGRGQVCGLYGRKHPTIEMRHPA